jgi:hypothetical protein
MTDARIAFCAAILAEKHWEYDEAKAGYIQVIRLCRQCKGKEYRERSALLDNSSANALQIPKKSQKSLLRPGLTEERLLALRDDSVLRLAILARARGREGEAISRLRSLQVRAVCPLRLD